MTNWKSRVSWSALGFEKRMADVVYQLPKDALLPLALHFEQLAAQLLARHATLEARAKMQRQVEARRAELRGLGKLIKRRLALGEQLEEAIVAVTISTGFSKPVIEFHWRHYEKERQKADRVRRNREVMRLAARGWTNTQIGKQFGLHKGSVSRIVRSQSHGPPPPVQAG